MLRAHPTCSARGRCLSILFTMAALTTGSQPLWGQNAQRNPKGAAGNSAMEIAKAEGKLEAQQGQTIKISSAEKKDFFLVASDETSLKYSGEADAKWLVPGLMVRFSTNFDQGQPAGPLKSLEVFMPIHSNRLTMEQAREQMPGIYQEGKAPLPGAKGLFADDKKDPKKGGNVQPQAQPPAAGSGSQSYRVVGSLRGVHQNTLIIAAGAQPLQVELDPAATILVTAADLSFAAQGDSVTVSGLRNPAQPEWIQAEKIEIKAAKKLTQAQPAPRGGKMRGGGRGRNGNANFGDPQNGAEGDKAPGANANDKPNDGRRPAAGDRRPPAGGRAPSAK